MATKGVGTFIVHSSWDSGNLVFYERAVGRTATGDIFTIAGGTTGYVRVGGTGQDIDFQWYSTGSVSAIFDAGASSLTLVGVNLATNAPVVITDATATSSTTTGALIVTGGIATAADVYVGDDITVFDDILLSATSVINFGAGDVTITGAANLLTMAGGAMNFGVDDTGIDVKAFGSTASAYMEWDESADRLNIVTVSGRAISGEEHAVDITNGGTVSSGDSMVGLNVVTTASGTAASWISGLFVKAVQASKVTNGYIGGAEIELQSTAANASDNSVLYLNSTRNHTGSAPAADPYITLREYGTTYANTFVRIFGDTGQGDTTTFDVTKLVTEVQDTYEINCRCAIRCMYGSTPMWIMASTTAPTS